MNLREMVEKYRTLGSGFGQAVPLADFGMPRQETERVFSALDEDYHISRFFRFSLDPAYESRPESIYRINDIAQSHISIDHGILEIL